MKYKFMLLITILFASTEIFALTHVTTKEIKLQGGYGSVVESAIRTITSQGLTQYVGMPFDIFDDYVQYSISADNPSYGQKIIARWDLLSNCDFRLDITATPLMHVNDPSHRPLYFRVAHHFELSYITNTGDTSMIGGFYVFEPDESKTDGSGTTRVFSDGSYLNCEPVFSEICNQSHANTDAFIGAVNDDIYFGFTYNTSQYLATDEAKTELPDGNYRATVTITMTAI